MFCYNCGNKLADGVRFCEKCGAPVAVATAPEETVQPAASEQPAAPEIPTFIPPEPEAAAQEAPAAPEIPTYIPPQYAAPSEADLAAERSGKIFSILSLIAGCISIFLGWIPFMMLVPEILAIVFGIVGMKKSKQRGMGIAGLILGIVALLVTILMTVLVIALAAGVMGEAFSYSYIY